MINGAWALRLVPDPAAPQADWRAPICGALIPLVGGA